MAVETWYIVDNATTMGTHTLSLNLLVEQEQFVAGSKHILFGWFYNVDVLDDAGNITANGTLDVAGDVFLVVILCLTKREPIRF